MLVEEGRQRWQPCLKVEVSNGSSQGQNLALTLLHVPNSAHITYKTVKAAIRQPLRQSRQSYIHKTVKTVLYSRQGRDLFVGAAEEGHQRIFGATKGKFQGENVILRGKCKGESVPDGARRVFLHLYVGGAR